MLFGVINFTMQEVILNCCEYPVPPRVISDQGLLKADYQRDSRVDKQVRGVWCGLKSSVLYPFTVVGSPGVRQKFLCWGTARILNAGTYGADEPVTVFSAVVRALVALEMEKNKKKIRFSQ